jgi:predicted nucleotidyltransferase component of viral defense system
MTGKKPKDLAASVRQRLMNVARAEHAEFQYLVTRYGLERLLYRLSQSAYAGRFILKGAMLFQLWAASPQRPTRDLDLLAIGAPSASDFEEAFRNVCRQQVDDDGLTFDADAIHAEPIKEEDEYQGIRIRGQAKLGNMRVPLQIDIGFGDVVTPRPVEIEYPTLLEFPAPRLLAYNRESVVAEKFQAMVLLGMANSRMKDFFDVWSLAREFVFAGAALAEAIAATFKRRKTALPESVPVALSDAFALDAQKGVQWQAFLRKGNLAKADLPEVIELIRQFLMPPMEALRNKEQFLLRWMPGGRWDR